MVGIACLGEIVMSPLSVQPSLFLQLVPPAACEVRTGLPQCVA